MTNEHNFKVGDIVRYIGKCRCYVETDIDPKDTYAVKSVKDDEVVIDVPSEAVIWEHHLELVKPYDRKTDFLHELQVLLRKYDAKISYDTQCDKFEIYFCDGYKIVDRIFYPLKYPEFIEDGIDDIGYLNLDADNIMDFDKD